MHDTSGCSYDDVPYDHLAFPQTHPDRLATIARMFGLSSPDVARCRVLELGCASGGNLIPMAFNLPDAEFIGIDLSQIQVDRAQATILALGMRNIRITHGSILDIDESWDRFDYIICHGVFSWVEPHVQDKILRIAHENLSPNGVAYVSYNTYPGWHMREMVRHMMRYHAGRFDEPTEQIEQARALLDFLASSSDESGPYGQLLSREIERLSGSSDAYLYHEHLEATNAPLYFHQFIERAERAGLQYLSEVELSAMLASLLPTPIANTLEQISPDILHLEQYMDFVRNRLFRQTLLCHKGLRPRRALTPSLLHGLMVSSPATTEPASPDLTPGTAVVFASATQRADSALPATKAGFALLMERWPQPIDVDELVVVALERAAPFLTAGSREDARRTLVEDLFKGVIYGMINLHTEAPRCTNKPTTCPLAHPFAVYQAQTGNIVVNAHHQTLQLEALAVEVLKLSNGQRSRREIVEGLIERHQSGAFAIQDRGQPVTDLDAVRTILAERLESTLQNLARSAVILG